MGRAHAWVVALATGLAALPALAEPPRTSPVPPLRPAAIEAQAQAEAGSTATLPVRLLRPRPRPEGLAGAAGAAAAAPVAPAAVAPAPVAPAPIAPASPVPDVAAPAAAADAAPPAPMPLSALATSLRPRSRPDGLAPAPQPVALSAARPAPVTTPGPQPPAKAGKPSMKGAVCGTPGIKGEKLAPITSKIRGCGVEAPVRVTSIDGIRLSQPATLNCQTAGALQSWIERGMKPAFGGREVVELQIAASYICRPRNNVKGAKISEHGRGNAIDIAGFVFSDGSVWTVLNDYNTQIRKAHKAACGIFGTTLGPGSDGYHENHLHFDTASYRGGPYCR